MPFFRKRTEAKASGPMIALSQLSAAQWGGRDAGSLIHAGFRRNPVGYRCVRMIAEAAASVRLRAEGDNALGALISRPSPEESGAELLERFYGALQVYGTAYLEAVASDPGGVPDMLFALPPDQVRALRDRRGWVRGHAIRNRTGERLVYRSAEGRSPILSLKLYDPSGRDEAQSPMRAAACAIELHNASADWAKALIDNSAKPSGALVYGKDGARLTDEQFDRLKGELEGSFQGAGNAGRPLLLEGGLDWKPMSLTPAEMDFQEARHGAAREIALAFGVPPMLLGIPGDNTYANYREANLAFWRLTILPLVTKTAAALSEWLAPHFDGGTIRPDLETVSALQPEREAQWRRIGAADFLSADEKRALLGLGT
jgi:HK97 family phage portal protein